MQHQRKQNIPEISSIPVEMIFILGSTMDCPMGLLSLYHLINGAGFPFESHLSRALAPTGSVWFCGPSVMIGGGLELPGGRLTGLSEIVVQKHVSTGLWIYILIFFNDFMTRTWSSQIKNQRHGNISLH